MLFSSIPFLYYFLPCVLLVYLIAPRFLKNTVLLLASLIFYAWGEPRYVVLMVATIVSGYVFGLLIERWHGKTAGKICLVLSVVSSVAVLGYFKYADFMIENFNALTGLSVPMLRIALPIGISFYTFQVLSYTVDVYRGEVPAQRNPITLATYVALFPQLIAGPIVRYTDIEKQLTERTHTAEKIATGARRFVMGLAKKILIANALGELCNIFRGSDDLSILFFWMYGIAFTLHIYFDFSGYSDMAIGLGRIFGFEFIENFNYPYISKSVTEFWRRWHISLGSWFRDYVYIPLGGNRVSKVKWFRNIFVVWLLTGFWHGAAWNFIIWGLLYGVFLVIEKVWLKKHLDRHAALSHVYVMILVMLGFIIFNAADMAEAGRDIVGLIGIGGYPLISTEALYYLRSFAVVLVLAIIGATPYPKQLSEKVRAHAAGGKVLAVVEPIFLAILVLVMTAYLVDGSFNPFLYFRF